MRSLLLVLMVLFFASCNDDVTIKPSANINCPYNFEKNKMGTVSVKQNCAVNIEYPQMNATLYLTYIPVSGRNLDSLLVDAQKLTYDHNMKAQAIFEQPRVDSLNNVYGMFYAIDGNAATQSQFYVTDSLRHFVQGSLYFNAKPNYDSVFPAVMYLRNDIRHIMETIEWAE